MSSIWVITEYSIEGKNVAGVFSTKEKAWEFYKTYTKDVDEQLFSQYREPEEVILNPTASPKSYKVHIYKINNEWKNKIVGISNSLVNPFVSKSDSDNYFVTVPYNANKEVVINLALSYFFKYLAENEI